MPQERIRNWHRAWKRGGRHWQELAGTLASGTGWKVWNPGVYGERWHSRFRACYPPRIRPLILLGLNPGPYGMGQTGIPFTDIKRLCSDLPRLAVRLREDGEPLSLPGLAPPSLCRFLHRTFESSSVRVYRFLSRGWGSAEDGWRDVVAVNPCSLLFMDPESGENRTPSDLGRALRKRAAARRVHTLLEQTERLRGECALSLVEALQARGVVLLGRDVQAALGDMLADRLGGSRVVSWPHPARAVPDAWASGLLARLRRSRLLPRGQ